MPFKIIFDENQEMRSEIRDHLNLDSRREYDTAQEAQRPIDDVKRYCKERSFPMPKVRIQKVVTAAWEEREAKRLTEGTYTPLPDWWRDMYFWRANKHIHGKHFAHVADKDPSKIAFTESPEKGEADIQLVMTPTAYLSRFFKDFLNQREIRDIGSRYYLGDFELKISDKPEDFERVYEAASEVCGDGSDATSCMRYTRKQMAEMNGYTLPHHPSYVYGAGDLAIAWIEDEDSSIVGRAVIWPEKKTYVRVYGNTANHHAMMHTLLKAQGYTHVPEMEGAKLLKIPVTFNNQEKGRKYYLMPYLDNRNSRYIEDKGDHFVMTRDENFPSGGNTGGWIQSYEMVTCVKSGAVIPSHRARLIDGQWYSEREYMRLRNVNYCDRSEEYTLEPIIRVIGRHGYTEWVRESLVQQMQTFRCERNGFLVDMAFWQPVQVHTRHGIQTWGNYNREAYRRSRTDGNLYAEGYYPDRQTRTPSVSSDSDTCDGTTAMRLNMPPSIRAMYEEVSRRYSNQVAYILEDLESSDTI